MSDARIAAVPDIHGHAKGEHRPFSEERPLAYSARMLFLWFYHACRRGSPRFMMVSDHINYLTFEDPGAVNTVRRALKLAQAGDLYGAAELASVDVAHAAVVSEGLRRGMRFSIGAELDNDPRSRPDAQNIVDAMRPDGLIRSVHFLSIDHPEKGADFQWPFDNPEFVSLFDHVGVEKTWEMYVEKLIDDIEKQPGHIVGHFYVPAVFGHWPNQQKLEEYEDRMLDACATRGMAVEINTRFFYRDHSEDEKKKYRTANVRLMRKAKEKNVGIAIGSDAHSPKDQGNAFDLVLEMLDEVDINEIVFPVGGRLARVALRATREHLERHAAPLAKPQPGSSISGFGRAELGLPEPADASEITSKASRTKRAVGPKKRTTGPERVTKQPAKSTSSSSSSKAHAVPKKPAVPAKTEAQPAKKAPAVKAEPVAKKLPITKKAPVVKAAPAAKIATVAKVAVKKAPAKPAAKVAAKKAAPVVKKTSAVKKATVPAKKTTPIKKAVAKKPAVKKVAPAKKAPPKKVAIKKAVAKKAASKKPVKKRR